MGSSSQLTTFLKQASQKLRALAHQQEMMLHFNSAEDLAIFIEAQITNIENEQLAHDDFEQLKIVFSPLCEWDALIDDVVLRSEIFEALTAP